MIVTKDGHKCTPWILKRITAAALLSIVLIGAIMLSCLAGGSGLFGYQARIVMSPSMQQSGPDNAVYPIRDIPAGSLIVIRLLPRGERARGAFYAALEIGDVLTFSYKIVGRPTVVTHRIRRIEARENGYLIVLSGDNGAHAGTQTIDTSDAQSVNRVIGKVVSKSYFLGILLCMLRCPQFPIAVCTPIVAALFIETVRGRERLSLRPKALRAGGTMKNKIIIPLVALLAVCLFALAIGMSFGLYDETVSIPNHLVAGSLKATLERVKLTSYNIGSDGNFSTVVDEQVKDFSKETQESVFGIAEGMRIAPGSTFTAEMRISNGGEVAFYYYIETLYNDVVSDKTFASMLQLTVSAGDGVQREVQIADGLTQGEEDDAIGTVDVGGSENFTVTLKFLDDEGNNKVENKFVLFDICIHAVQKIGA